MMKRRVWFLFLLLSLFSFSSCNRKQISTFTITGIGTSVMFGSNAKASYLDYASQELGFTMKNCAVPGISIHTAADGGIFNYSTLSLSKQEYQNLNVEISSTPLEYKPGGSFNNYYSTYENVFTIENKADLYLLAFAPNNEAFDYSLLDLFDLESFSYKDGVPLSDRRDTFVGALLFLMEKLYQMDANAKVAFVLDSTFSYQEAKPVYEALAPLFHATVIDLWKNIKDNDPKDIYMNPIEDFHPSKKAQITMGSYLVEELKKIVY